MDSFIHSVDSQSVLVIAAIVVAFLLGRLVLTLLRTSLGLIFSLLAIGLILQYGFGIGPSQLWREIGNLPQEAMQLVQNIDLNAITSLFSS